MQARLKHLTGWRILFAALVLTIAVPTVAMAAVPVSLQEQGRLLDSSGKPVTGSTTLTFTIYDAKTGGAILWQGQVNATLDSSGFYSVTLGDSTNPINPTVLKGGQAWIGVKVNSGQELTPRMPLSSVPFAVVANQAQSVADGSITAASLSPNFSVSAGQVAGVSWSNIVNVPANLNALGDLSCAKNQVAQFDGTNWKCADLPTYDGSTFATSNQGCQPGQVVTGIDATGKVTCAADKVNTYNGTNFATSNQGCQPGQIVTGVDKNGHLTCVNNTGIWSAGGASAAIIKSITIRAKADCGSVKPVPHMVAYVDQHKVAEWDIGNASYADYQTTLTTPMYGHEVDVAFTNDNNAGNCDHNLYVDSITLDNGTTIKSSDANRVIYDIGAFFDDIDVQKGAPTMPYTGALRFMVAPGAGEHENLFAYGQWENLNDNTNTSPAGNPLPYVVKYTKKSSSSLLKLTLSANLRTYGANGVCCRWALRVNGQECNPAINGNVYISPGGNYHQHRTITGICQNIPAGPITVQPYVETCPGVTPGDCYTGWNSMTSLQVQEINQ